MKLWTDDGRTTEPAYTISSPGAFGSGELIKREEICIGDHCELSPEIRCVSHIGLLWDIIHSGHREFILWDQRLLNELFCETF